MRPKNVKAIIDGAVDEPLVSPPIMLWGPPGCGKSSIPKQIAEEKKIGFIDIRGPQLDPTDLRGIPTVSGDKAKWLPPTFLPTSGKGILFLDELPSAPPLVQASMYQLTLDRAIGEYKLPDGWYVVGAGNRIEDRAVSYRMPSALANRFIHIEFEVNLDDWIDWARVAQVNPNIIMFIKFKPELLFAFRPDSSEKAFPTPRTWDFASRMCRITPTKLLPEALEGTIGKGATAEFMSFLKLQTELPDINTIINGDNFVPQRLDLKYALVAALATRVKGTKQYERMIQYSNVLDAEFAVLLITMLAQKDEAAMALAPSFEKWAISHSDLIVSKRSIK
jgi:hypothetical protein